MSDNPFTRRNFLKLASLTGAGAAGVLAACQTAAPLPAPAAAWSRS